MKKFEGKPCYLFLDLSSKKDIASMYSLFRNGNNKKGKKRYATFGLNFLPRDVVSKKLVGRRSEYNAWAEAGHFVLTDGNTTDYEVIEDHIKQWNNKYKVMKVGFDPWNTGGLPEKVHKMRLKTVMIKQITPNLSLPMKTLDAWIIDKYPRITHTGDPVLTWALGNVVAKEDAGENVYPRKNHKDNKIDPAVSVINLVAMELEEPLPEIAVKRIPKVW